MRDHHDRLATLIQRFEQVEHLFGGLGIEIPGRFVG